MIGNCVKSKWKMIMSLHICAVQKLPIKVINLLKVNQLMTIVTIIMKDNCDNFIKIKIYR